MGGDARWSFCIVTNNNDSNLKLVIDSIFNELKNREFEIIVVGNSNINFGEKINHIPFPEEKKLKNIDFKMSIKKLKIIYKIPISAKKNIAVKNTKYENLCIMHDYVLLKSGWIDGFTKFGYEWDICSNIILDKFGMRFLDWVVWDHPDLEGPGYLPYDASSPYVYVSGTYFCVKRDFYLLNPLHNKKNWGYGEDVEWSKRVRKITKIKFNPHSTVLVNKDKGVWSHEGQWKINTEKLKSI